MCYRCFGVDYNFFELTRVSDNNWNDCVIPGYDTVIPIIITNSGEFEEVIVNAEASVTHEDKLMTVISK